ncbi:hypothetical protein ES707_09777 [subsurface metagenome]
MEVSSVTSRSDVKQKPPAFSAHSDSSDSQFKISQAGRLAKSIQDSNLQNTGLGARAGPGLRLRIIVTIRLSPTCGKWILNVWRYYHG